MGIEKQVDYFFEEVWMKSREKRVVAEGGGRDH